MSLITSRAEWLASLQAEDLVGVSYGRHTSGWVGVIARKTAAGKMWIRDATGKERSCFTPDGNVYPRNESGPTLAPPDEVTERNRKLAEQAAFVAAAGELERNRHYAGEGFDFAAHTATIRAITAAIKGKKPC